MILSALLLFVSIAPAETIQPAIPGYTGEAKAVFDRACRLYQSAETYQDRFTVQYEYDAEGEVDKLPSIPPQEMALYFEKPNRFAVLGSNQGFVSDGAVLWQYQKAFEQYTEEPVSEILSFESDDPDSLRSRGLYHLILPALIEPVEKRLENLESFGRVLAEERDGRPGRWIEMVYRNATSPEPIDLKIWFDDDTGRIEELVYDMTRALTSSVDYYQQEYQVTVKRVRMRAILQDIRINEPLPAERFSFTPEPGMKRVDRIQYDPQISRSKQIALIGKPAPSILGEDLDGRQVKPEELAGKVVLLDFWATWCGPCVAALPEIEKLSQLFKDEPVVVLGVNQDSAGSGDRVRRFLKNKEVTYRQIYDPEGSLGKKFHVSGIPCIVLIDARGVIQYIDSGYAPGMTETLEENLEKLLAGDQIYDPEEIERELAQLRTGEERPEIAAQDAIPEFEPQRLLKPRTITRWVTGWKSRLVDVDQDGRDQLVMPGYGGRIVVYRPGMRRPDEITLEGLANTGYLEGFVPVALEGRIHWFVAAETSRGLLRRRYFLQTSLHDPEGRLVWKHELPLPQHSHANTSLAAGDLDGDGRPEFAVVRQEEPRILIVLGSDGDLISRCRLRGEASSVRILPASQDEPGEIIVLDEGGAAAAYILRSDKERPPAPQATVPRPK